MRLTFDFDQITVTLFKIMRLVLIIGGGVLLIQVCAHRDSLEFLNYLFGGALLLAYSGWSVVIFRLSETDKPLLRFGAGIMALLTGPTLLNYGFLDFSLFIPSDSETVQLILGNLIGLLIAASFSLLGLSILMGAISATRKGSPTR